MNNRIWNEVIQERLTEQNLKVGQLVKIHKHGGIYVSGKITKLDKKTNYITASSNDNSIHVNGTISNLVKQNKISF